ncbi:hypothetical protein MAPG_03508 [Magnaporthiopsis poae ATCC 64411]|uniref:AA1-like domain-containing protein n=1 Tax=Magnaporthiopsis poae (strain ATCC 64411 / 73-15) TaxID=644358 RepID=A0A0C4DU72_MAGP6|nr:hypothetical protein MAPG_03508 [Magnaporthiopsis poae ATCC 64411]
MPSRKMPEDRKSKETPEGKQTIAMVLPTLVALVLVLLIAVADSLRPLTVHAAPVSSAQALPGDLDVAEYLAASGRAREVKDCSRPGVTCSCQDWTFSQPTWNLTDFRYRSSLEIKSPGDDEDDAVLRREVSFVVRNKAVPYSTSCEASSNATDDFFYGDKWYTCDQHGDGESDKGPGLTWFRYDKADDMLQVKQTWLCSDHGRYNNSLF